MQIGQSTAVPYCMRQITPLPEIAVNYSAAQTLLSQSSIVYWREHPYPLNTQHRKYSLKSRFQRPCCARCIPL